jgi:hypothetical protein
MARFREGTGTSVVVALASTAIYALAAWVIVLLFWLAFSIYAIVELIGDGRPSALALLTIVVGLVAALVTLSAVGTWVVGRRLAPTRRGRPEA